MSLNSLNPLILEIAKLFRKTGKPFWLAGGYSIDALLGKKSRDHDDLDFVIRRSDQLFFQNILAGWDLQAADPPGSGLQILAPEIQLLYKSRSLRPKDLQDLQNCLAVLQPNAKQKLFEWIIMDSGSNHPWLKEF